MNLFDLTERLLLSAAPGREERGPSVGPTRAPPNVVTSRRRDACERVVDEIRAAGRQGRASDSQLRAQAKLCGRLIAPSRISSGRAPPTATMSVNSLGQPATAVD